MPPQPFNYRLPGDNHRTTIVGRTGSGKTQAAVWQLAHRSFTKMPWIIFDFKRDSLIAKINGTKDLEPTDSVPKKPGLYILRLSPRDKPAAEDMLWNIWERGKTGIYIDEGYMIDRDSEAFQAVLTQGRSKLIPTILLSQRPVFLSRFAFTEAEFLQVFKLQDKRDYPTVKSFCPLPIENRLKPFHSWWYDGVQDAGAIMSPVPDEDTILAKFRSRLGSNVRKL
jgi:hypothetical protein